jgi:UDP-N-acetylmuramyl pentapeptide synthase
MRAALELLAGLPGRRLAVLGEMRELGAASATLHREVGRFAAEQGVDVLIAVGPAAHEMRAGALEGGMSVSAAPVVHSQAEAAMCVRERMRPGGVVLIKGSRGARMEEVLAHLREER